MEHKKSTSRAIEIRSDGTIWFMPDCPEEPNPKDFQYKDSEGDMILNRGPFNHALSEYRDRLAAAKQSAVPFDQDQIKAIIMTECLPKNSIHPFPDLYEVEIKLKSPLELEYCTPTHGKYKAVAVLSVKQEDEKNGMYQEREEELRWISVEERLPVIGEDGESEEVLCLGFKCSREGTETYEIMRWRKLEKPDLLDHKGKPVEYGWSNRWWNTNPDGVDVHYWMPLCSPGPD